MALKIRVESPKVKYTENYLEAEYEYQTTKITRIQDQIPNYTVSFAANGESMELFYFL